MWPPKRKKLYLSWLGISVESCLGRDLNLADHSKATVARKQHKELEVTVPVLSYGAAIIQPH